MSKKADQVRAAGEIAQILPETYSFLQQNFNDTRVDRAAAIKGIVHHLSKAHPNRHVMVCHPPHIANLEDAAKMRLELKTGLWGTTGVDIYVFTQGTFTNLGDGGDINWCFHGNFVRDPGHPNTVTFSRIY